MNFCPYHTSLIGSCKRENNGHGAVLKLGPGVHEVVLGPH